MAKALIFIILTIACFVAAWAVWEKHRGAAAALLFAGSICAVIATILAIIAATIWIFKLIPVALLVLGVYLIWKKVGAK